jgi:hypothetical protein
MRLDRRSVVFGAAGLLGAGCASTAARGAFDDASGAFEHGDATRAGVFPQAAPFASTGGAAEALRAPAPMPGLWNVAFDRRGRGFALHGVLGGGAGQMTPTVSGFDPETLQEAWRTPLPLAGPDLWNYPGSVAVHANGDVYVAYTCRMAKLDPATGRVLAVADLPAPNGLADTTYNGFTILSDGTIHTKSHHRKGDCPAQGYRAFIECGVDGLPASALVLLDPETLQRRWTGAAPELIGGRVTLARRGDRELVYLAGDTFVHRMVYDGRSLREDTSWPAVRYRDGAETPGTAVVVFGDQVVIQNNAIPTRAPLRVTFIAQDDPQRVRSVAPYPEAAWSFMPSKVSADASLGLVYSADAHSGLAAIALEASGEPGVRWRAPYRTGSFLTLLGDAPARTMVISDIGEAPFDEFGAPRHMTETVHWLSARDGRRLASIPDLPRNFGLTLTPWTDGSIFMATRTSGLYRLRPGP